MPLGRLVNVSDGGPRGAIITLNGPLVLCCGFELSVTFTVMFDVPAVVGVPLTVHPAGVSVRPAGSVPVVMVQVYGVVPPVARIVAKYG